MSVRETLLVCELMQYPALVNFTVSHSWLKLHLIFYVSLYSGVLALAATQQYFLLSEVALRILPALCQLTVDSEKSVRDNVFRTIKGFLGKLEKVSEDPSLRESMGKSTSTSIECTVSNGTCHVMSCY